MSSPLRVCLDARVIPGKSGGLEQFIIGMANGLSSLRDGDEEYLFLVNQECADWITPYLGGACRLLIAQGSGARRWRRSVISVPAVRHAWDWLSPFFGPATVSLPVSDGTVERAGVEVMHMTLQLGFLTDLPTIYHPHDLQYMHLPQYFSRRRRLTSDVYLRTLSERANLVAVASSWCKQDVMRQYGIAEEKIAVVPLAPASSTYAPPTAQDIETVSSLFSLPPAFVFYPAQTWPHKNHISLLKALAWLRDRRGIVVPFVSSGFCNDFFPTIQAAIRELRLDAQVKFLGFVSTLQMQCLYTLSRCVVIPTKFEAASFPLWEAFLAGVPAACSNVTSLPEQAGDAALIFDPENIEQIAKAIETLWINESLRADLSARGRAKVAQFSWNTTARTFRSHYRRLANRDQTDEDHLLLCTASPAI
jgi:glycosyltransferase involved in cell wall biosynthesis